MNIQRGSESKIFLVTLGFAIALSTAAVIFTAVRGPGAGVPNPTTPHAHASQGAVHRRHSGHPPLWLMEATDWIVSVADRAFS